MPVVEVAPAVFGFHAGEVAVEVAVRLLGGEDEVDGAVEFLRQSGVIRFEHQGVGDSFEHLGHVGIPEDVGPVRHARFPVEPEGVEAAGDAALFEGARQRRVKEFRLARGEYGVHGCTAQIGGGCNFIVQSFPVTGGFFVCFTIVRLAIFLQCDKLGEKQDNSDRKRVWAMSETFR